MTPPSFLYFDLGNVLLHFDHRRAARQMAEVSGADPEAIWQLVFESDLELRYEANRITSDEFYQVFCRETRTRPDRDRLEWAAAAIFDPNASIAPVVAQLAAAGHRLGVLSNTNEVHWRYLTGGRYWIVPGPFERHALSFQIGAVKPEPKVYEAAARIAGVEPREIFFVDDRADNVAGAIAAGFDAVRYTTTSELVRELRERGIRLNY